MSGIAVSTRRIRHAAEVYDTFRSELTPTRADADPETTLELIQTLAAFAATHHTGRFSDGTLDQLAIHIGESLAGKPQESRTRMVHPRPPTRSRRVLHVATSVREVGGHTRTIANWIRLDRDSQHALAITQQGERAVPLSIVECLAAEGHLNVAPASFSLLDRAKWLRELAMLHDFVVLHQDVNDVVPLVALGTSESPPVAYVNFADHLFWIGGSVADLVVTLRNASRLLYDDRRNVHRDALLPIPLSQTSPRSSTAHVPKPQRHHDSDALLVSVGRGLKYKPCVTHDFLRTASRLLDRVRNARIYVVGLSPDDASRWSRSVHTRLHLVGELPDASGYQNAAHVYLEGFPFGSQTALLEGAMAGVPPVRAYAPLSPLLVADDCALDGLIPTPMSEAEYIDEAVQLLADSRRRDELGREVGARTLAHHTGELWSGYLGNVYRQLSTSSHKPRVSLPCEPLLTPADHAVSELQAIQRPLNQEEGVLDDMACLLRDAAYWQRRRGRYRSAWKLVSLAGRRSRWNRDLVTCACKLAVGSVVDNATSLLRTSQVRS